jgi:hypothetical protein
MEYARSVIAKHTNTLQKVDDVDLTRNLNVRMVNKEPIIDKEQNKIAMIITTRGGCQTSITNTK